VDLSPGQRKAAFAAIVVALLALGAFLLVPRLSGARPAPAGGSPVAASSHVPQPSATATASPLATAAGASAAPSDGGPVNIYQWLPFSQAGLAKAASVVRQFAADYATYSYTQSPQAYVAPMKGMITGGLSAVLARSFATTGVAKARQDQKEVAVGSGTITALRGFGSSSLTFLVTVSQKITSKQGSRNASTDYAITVTGAGTGWQVSDIELASAGNS
jgi:hypothetical protein